MESAATPSAQIVHPLIAERWSPRAYQDRPVEAEKLQRIFEAVRQTASSRNEQPWRWLLGRKDASRNTWQRIFDSLLPGNQRWNGHTPVLLLLIGKTFWDHNGKSNTSYTYDCGAAAATLAYQALAEGLYVRQMAGIDSEKARTLFRIPEGYEPLTAIALGYLASPEVLPEDMRAGETRRAKKPVTEILFENDWEQPAAL